MKDLEGKLLDVLNRPTKLNMLKSQQEYVFEPIIRHNLRFEDARTILEFFGTLADHGKSPIELLQDNLSTFTNLDASGCATTKTTKKSKPADFAPRFSPSVSSLLNYPLKKNLPFYYTEFLCGKEYKEKQSFRLLPAGTFDMGSHPNEYGRSDDETRHLVEITRPFLMATTPVTQRFWKHIMSENPSFFAGPERPVETVSWHDCQEFIQRLNNMTNEGVFRLPTEAEWEYACRAGTSTPFNTGENLTTNQANYDGDYPYRNFPKGEYLAKTTPVGGSWFLNGQFGSYPPNAWGLYDMHGNVMEWCQDWYDKDYYEECTKNPQGPETGSLRVLRGGSWDYDAQDCRSAYRYSGEPGRHGHGTGFRLVFVPKG